MKRVSIVFLLLLLLGLVGCGGTETLADNTITQYPNEGGFLSDGDKRKMGMLPGADTDVLIANKYFEALSKSDYDLLQSCFSGDDLPLDEEYDRYKEIADTGYFYTYDTTQLNITKYNIKSDEIQMKVTCPCKEGHPGSMYKSTAELNIIAYQKDGIYYIDQTQSDKYIKTTNLIPIPD